MNDMGQETQKNRKLLYIVIIILFIFSGFFLKFSQRQKRDNKAIQIKLITLNRTRNITPWQGLISRPQIEPVAQDTVTTRASSTISPPAQLQPQLQSEQLLQNLSVQELAIMLSQRMAEIKSQDLANIDKNIEIADEIILQEPDSYSAYKAKLISLLIKEGRLNQVVEDNEINSILETMASFNLTNDSVTSKEGVLISNTNQEITSLTETLNKVSADRIAIEEQMDLADPNSSETAAMEIERQNLLAIEEETANKIYKLDDQLSTGFPASEYLNEDVIQVPFLRMMAKNDYEGVIDNATTFIEQFPESPDGYYFLIKGLEATGRNEDAQRVIEESELGPEAQNILQQRLQNTSFLDPKKYWERLQF